MRTLLRLAVGGLLALTVGAAWAQEVGESAPDVEFKESSSNKAEGSLLEDNRNRIIVLVFFRTFDAASIDLFPVLNELHDKYNKRGVSIIAISDEKMERVKSTAEGKGFKFRYTGEVNPDRPYKFSAPPEAYIIDIYGKVAYARFHPADDLEEKIKKVIERGAPPGSDKESLKRHFERLTKLMLQEDCGRAYTLAKELEDWVEGEDESATRRIDDLIEKIEKMADDWLKKARDEIEQKDYAPACRKLAVLSVRFHDSEIKERADRELGRLQGDNLTKPLVRKAVENAEAEVENDNAAALEMNGRYLEARDVYRGVTEDYEGTEAAREAADAIDRLGSDPAVQKEICKTQAAQQAGRWYDLGERYARVQLFALAREQLEQVIKDYPESHSAEKARKRLGELDSEERKAKEEAERRAALKAERAKQAAERAEELAAEKDEEGDKDEKKRWEPRKSKKKPKPKPRDPKPDRGRGRDRPRGGGGGGG